MQWINHNFVFSYLFVARFYFYFCLRRIIHWVICIAKKKKLLGWLVKLFSTLFKLNITFYFKYYLDHNCSVKLNWNNTQLYSSARPLCNVPSSLLWFVIFCFLPPSYLSSPLQICKLSKPPFLGNLLYIGFREHLFPS